MVKYIIKRVITIIPTLLLVSFIVFFILEITAGDPGRIILGPSAPQEAVDQLNNEFGYNKPFLERYFNYIGNIVFHGDFGKSYQSKLPVVDELFHCFPVTLKLAFFSIILTSTVGILVGVISAVKQYSALDYISSVTAILMSAIPVFWFGLMMIIVFALRLHLLPSGGVQTWQGYILPIITISLPYSGLVMRMTRSSMLESINQDYVRTARAKGAPESRVIFRHALKNALLPVVTVLGTTFGISLGGAILTESVFSLNGVGTLLIKAIKMKDIPLTMGSILILSSMFCLVILIVDVLYGFIDPRVKAIYKQ